MIFNRSCRPKTRSAYFRLQWRHSNTYPHSEVCLSCHPGRPNNRSALLSGNKRLRHSTEDHEDDDDDDEDSSDGVVARIQFSGEPFHTADPTLHKTWRPEGG